jgi:hypothetical protein
MTRLQYEPDAAARPVLVEHDGGTTQVIVPIPGLYVPVSKWVTDLDLLSLLIVPVWWVSVLVIRTCLRLPNPPRAVFTVGRDLVTMTYCDPTTGDTGTFDWPRAAVAEIRANRYAPGLWVDVPGHVKDTFLMDLSQETIARLEAALAAALADAGGRVAGG